MSPALMWMTDDGWVTEVLDEKNERHQGSKLGELSLKIAFCHDRQCLDVWTDPARPTPSPFIAIHLVIFIFCVLVSLFQPCSCFFIFNNKHVHGGFVSFGPVESTELAQVLSFVIQFSVHPSYILSILLNSEHFVLAFSVAVYPPWDPVVSPLFFSSSSHQQ